MGTMTMLGNPMLATQGLANSTATRLRANADTGGTSGTKQTSDSYSVDSIGSTFLSLLVQELQNQDPTSPMDSTQMVGQMISLNQLNELASIDQTLTKAYPSTSTTTTPSGKGVGSTSSSGATSGTGSNANVQAAPESRTEAALRLLQSGAALTQPRVSTSVTLPAF